MIENKDLTLADIPVRDSGLIAASEFSATFDGYNVAGSFENCAEIAQSPRMDSLTDLRISLFFRFRSMRHTGGPTNDVEKEKIWDIIEHIRELVAKRETG